MMVFWTRVTYSRSGEKGTSLKDYIDRLIHRDRKRNRDTETQRDRQRQERTCRTCYGLDIEDEGKRGTKDDT